MECVLAACRHFEERQVGENEKSYWERYYLNKSYKYLHQKSCLKSWSLSSHEKTAFLKLSTILIQWDPEERGCTAAALMTSLPRDTYGYACTRKKKEATDRVP